MNRLNTGHGEHKTKKANISHVLYMDNLKLIAKTEEELQKQIQTVKNSANINMEFELENCAKFTFKIGKLTHLKI